MLNYQSIATCACIGENLAVGLPIVNGLVRIPLFSTEELHLRVGLGCSWEQRRAFEWGLLAGVSRRNGDAATAEYCTSRVAELTVRVAALAT